MRAFLLLGLVGCVQIPRSSADSGLAGAADCPAWASISPQGSVRTFETTDAYEASTGDSSQYISEVTSIAVGTSGLDVRLGVEGHIDSESWDSYTYQITSHYRCDGDGAWLLNSELAYTLVSKGLTVENQAETVYTDVLIMPRVIEQGDTWHSVFTGTTTDSTGNTSSFGYTIQSEVTANDTVNVGAGSFSAQVIRETFDDGSQSEYRVAEGPGFLLSDEYELVGYTAP